MDKNNVTGLLLISMLLIGYFMFFAPDPEQMTEGNQPPQADTTAVTQQLAPTDNTLPTAPAENQNQLPDSLLEAQYGFFASGMKGEASEIRIENDDIIVVLNAKGGTVQEVTLKNYVDYQQNTLSLIMPSSSSVSEKIAISNGEVDLNQLYYQVERQGNQVTFRLEQAPGVYFERVYSLEKSGFQLDYHWNVQGLENVITSADVNFYWLNNMRRLELALEQSRNQATVNYFTNDLEFDNLSETATSREEAIVGQPVKWVSIKQKFFNASILTDGQFNDVVVATDVDKTREDIVKQAEVSLKIPMQVVTDTAARLRFYFGPNDFHICEEVAPGFERNVYLGWSFFATINLYLIQPLFEFLERFFTNYGLIIFILVLIVKTILFPLTYRSYFSMAKTKVLKPEMDEIKEKYGDDMTKVQQEQMKLYQQVGVNPLSGCIPVLAQMPVFLALFNFFPNAIQLRQESFLWADDLSTYDSIVDLPFHIPFYGDHVSLFTLLFTLSQIAYTYYNNQMNPTVQGPAKTIGYVTPVIFMFFFNNFSSGLTYYYFISNIITIGQQLLIRRFIDEGKIRRVLDENKKKNQGKKKSKFQQRLEDAMKAQETQKPGNKQRRK